MAETLKKSAAARHPKKDRRNIMSTTNEQTQNANARPDWVAKTREGHGKNASFEQIGVGWSRPDGSVYFKPYGKQILDKPVYLFKLPTTTEG
jgi:hypothetical protein